MPAIPINDVKLHRRLRKELIDADDMTISEAHDLFTQFCLDVGVLNLSHDQRQKIVKMIGQKGWDILLEESKK